MVEKSEFVRILVEKGQLHHGTDKPSKRKNLLHNLNSSWYQMINKLEDFKSEQILLSQSNDTQEDQIQNMNRLIKNEVIDMADLVEDLKDLVTN